MSLANARKSPLAADYTNTFVATPQYNLGLHDDCPLTSCFVKKSETVRVLLKSCIKAKALFFANFSSHVIFFCHGCRVIVDFQTRRLDRVTL
jgi:hypothetical protein